MHRFIQTELSGSVHQAITVTTRAEMLMGTFLSHLFGRCRFCVSVGWSGEADQYTNINVFTGNHVCFLTVLLVLWENLLLGIFICCVTKAVCGISCSIEWEICLVVLSKAERQVSSWVQPRCVMENMRTQNWVSEQEKDPPQIHTRKLKEFTRV